MSVSLACAFVGGCFIDNDSHDSPPPESCATEAEQTYALSEGDEPVFSAGVDAGYYLNASAPGSWAFQWTCDTDLSAEGCEFTGTITSFDTPLEASCFQCEADDQLSVAPAGNGSVISFDTITTSGIDGVTFSGDTQVEVDLQINGIYQNDLVFLGTGGSTAQSPACLPAVLVAN